MLEQADAGAPAVPDRRRYLERAEWQRRRLLERRLHDGATLRASALVLQLALAKQLIAENDQKLREAIGGVQDGLEAVLQELRAVAAEIYPPLLDVGLGPALVELVAQLDVSATISIGPRASGFGAAAEGAAYFGLADGLVSLPAETETEIEIEIERDGDDLVMTITGAGPRFAELVLDRVSPIGGAVSTTPPHESSTGGSRVEVTVPCE